MEDDYQNLLSRVENLEAAVSALQQLLNTAINDIRDLRDNKADAY